MDGYTLTLAANPWNIVRRICAGVLLVHEEAVPLRERRQDRQGAHMVPLPQALSVVPHLESVREGLSLSSSSKKFPGLDKETTNSSCRRL